MKYVFGFVVIVSLVLFQHYVNHIHYCINTANILYKYECILVYKPDVNGIHPNLFINTPFVCNKSTKSTTILNEIEKYPQDYAINNNFNDAFIKFLFNNKVYSIIYSMKNSNTVVIKKVNIYQEYNNKRRMTAETHSNDELLRQATTLVSQVSGIQGTEVQTEHLATDMHAYLDFQSKLNDFIESGDNLAHTLGSQHNHKLDMDKDDETTPLALQQKLQNAIDKLNNLEKNYQENYHKITGMWKEVNTFKGNNLIRWIKSKMEIIARKMLIEHQIQRKILKSKRREHVQVLRQSGFKKHANKLSGYVDDGYIDRYDRNDDDSVEWLKYIIGVKDKKKEDKDTRDSI